MPDYQLKDSRLERAYQMSCSLSLPLYKISKKIRTKAKIRIDTMKYHT